MNPANTARVAVLRRKLAALRYTISQFPFLVVRHPNGTLVPIRAAMNELDRMNNQMAAEARVESGRHTFISGLSRLLMVGLPLLDFAIFFYYLVGVLNIDFTRVDMLVVLAGALALLSTVVVAVWNKIVGERLRMAKSDNGTLLWEVVSRTDRVMVTISVLIALLVGLLMYGRTIEEIELASGGVVTGAGIAVAVTLAASVVVLHLVVLVLSYNDGSTLSHLARRLRRAIEPHLRRHARIRQQADRLEAKLRVLDTGSAAPELPAA